MNSFSRLCRGRIGISFRGLREDNLFYDPHRRQIFRFNTGLSCLRAAEVCMYFRGRICINTDSVFPLVEENVYCREEHSRQLIKSHKDT